MSSLVQAEIINPVLLVAVIVSDVGTHRRIWWFRLVEPLLVVGVIVPFFIEGLTTSGNGAVLELVCLLVGVAVGIGALSLMRVYRSPRTGRLVTSAGWAYVALWSVVLGGRALFIYGSHEWFAADLGRWLAGREISGDAFTDAFIFIAIAPLLTRTVGLAVRARRHRDIQGAAPAPTALAH